MSFVQGEDQTICLLIADLTIRRSKLNHLALLGNCGRIITVTRTVQKRQFAQRKPDPNNPTSLGDFLRKQRLDQRQTQSEVAA
jgi:hypothetical protein